MNTLTFLPAKAEDADIIFARCRELVERYEDPTQVDIARVLSWLDKKIRTNISQYTCVLRGNEKVAFFCLSEEENGFELDDLYVLKPYRGQGIGSEILKHCIALASKPIFLYVFTANKDAVRLYRRLGFCADKQVSDTRIIMTRYP